MKILEVKCVSCGATVKAGRDDKACSCAFCGTHFLLSKDIHVKKVTYAGDIKLTPLHFVVAAVAAVLVIAAAVLLIISLTKTQEEPPPPSTPTVYEDPLAYKWEGVYEVGIGKDIEPGEYLVHTDPKKASGFVMVALTRSAGRYTADCLFYENVRPRKYIVVEAGQFVTVENANLFKPGVKNAQPGEDGGYLPVELKIGTDIPAGEYYLVKTGHPQSLARYYLKDSPMPLDKNTEKTSGLLYSFYVAAQEGKYLTFEYGTLYPLDKKPDIVRNGDGSYPPGQYRIGIDLPEGDYTLTTDKNTVFCHISYDTSMFTDKEAFKGALSNEVTLALNGHTSAYFLIQGGSFKPKE